MKRKHSDSGTSSSSLNDVLTSLSEVMKRVDKARDVVKKFGTILSQIKQIIHNDNSTLNSIENDVATWWLHVESQGKLRVTAIQKIRNASDESSIEMAASELTSVMNSTNNVEKSMRRWARLVQIENYSRESLREGVMEWTRRWVQRWRDVEDTYRRLRKELLTSCEGYTRLFKTRTSRNAVLDNAEEALENASDVVKSAAPREMPPQQQHVHQQHHHESHHHEVTKRSRHKKKKRSSNSMSPPTHMQAPQKEVMPQAMPQAVPQAMPQMPPGMTPEQFMQFMAYQQQVAAAAPHPQKPTMPASPQKGQVILKSNGVNVVTGNTIQDYSAAQWA